MIFFLSALAAVMSTAYHVVVLPICKLPFSQSKAVAVLQASPSCTPFRRPEKVSDSLVVRRTYTYSTFSSMASIRFF